MIFPKNDYNLLNSIKPLYLKTKYPFNLGKIKNNENLQKEIDKLPVIPPTNVNPKKIKSKKIKSNKIKRGGLKTNKILII